MARRADRPRAVHGRQVHAPAWCTRRAAEGHSAPTRRTPRPAGCASSSTTRAPRSTPCPCPRWKKTILRALATYGAYIGDTGGGGFNFQFQSGSTYTSFGAHRQARRLGEQGAGRDRLPGQVRVRPRRRRGLVAAPRDRSLRRAGHLLTTAGRPGRLPIMHRVASGDRPLRVLTLIDSLTVGRRRAARVQVRARRPAVRGHPDRRLPGRARRQPCRRAPSRAGRGAGLRPDRRPFSTLPRSRGCGPTCESVEPGSRPHPPRLCRRSWAASRRARWGSPRSRRCT